MLQFYKIWRENHKDFSLVDESLGLLWSFWTRTSPLTQKNSGQRRVMRILAL
jgi:hypothetical protein